MSSSNPAEQEMKELGEWLSEQSTVFAPLGDSRFEHCTDGNKWPKILKVLQALDIVRIKLMHVSNTAEDVTSGLELRLLFG